MHAWHDLSVVSMIIATILGRAALESSSPIIVHQVIFTLSDLLFIDPPVHRPTAFKILVDVYTLLQSWMSYTEANEKNVI